VDFAVCTCALTFCTCSQRRCRTAASAVVRDLSLAQCQRRQTERCTEIHNIAFRRTAGPAHPLGRSCSVRPVEERGTAGNRLTASHPARYAFQADVARLLPKTCARARSNPLGEKGIREMGDKLLRAAAGDAGGRELTR
jgi:hypothetical protein